MPHRHGQWQNVNKPTIKNGPHGLQVCAFRSTVHCIYLHYVCCFQSCSGCQCSQLSACNRLPTMFAWLQRNRQKPVSTPCCQAQQRENCQDRLRISAKPFKKNPQAEFSKCRHMSHCQVARTCLGRVQHDSVQRRNGSWEPAWIRNSSRQTSKDSKVFGTLGQSELEHFPSPLFARGSFDEFRQWNKFHAKYFLCW